MSTLINPTDKPLSQDGTAFRPTAHDMELAATSRQRLSALADATGELTMTITGAGGTTGEMLVPASTVRLLFAALSEMACGNGVSLLPETTELTTQEAANLLNVSRPYFVGLLEKGEMPFRLVGNQRRVKVQDVVAYKALSDRDRRTALDELAQLGRDIGIGYEV